MKPPEDNTRCPACGNPGYEYTNWTKKRDTQYDWCTPYIRFRCREESCSVSGMAMHWDIIIEVEGYATMWMSDEKPVMDSLYEFEWDEPFEYFGQ